MKNTIIIIAVMSILFSLIGCQSKEEPNLDLSNKLKELESEIAVLKEENNNLIEEVTKITNGKKELFNENDFISRAEFDNFQEEYETFISKVCTYFETNPSAFSNSNIYDPLNINIGDTAAGMILTKVDVGKHDGELFYAVISFCSKETVVSGSFENLKGDSEFYNGIIFTLDEESSKKIPLISVKKDKQIILRFDSAEAQKVFGPRGIKGKATIVISGYTEYYWPKDDIRDNTNFVRAISVNTTN